MLQQESMTRFVRSAFATAAGLGVFVSLPVAAQDVQKGERVEVTGSNIKRVESETASPVQVVSREDIARSGKTSVAELLQTLSVDNVGSVPRSFASGFSSGGAAVSLRGLGAGATLVLLNGRRVAPFAIADDGTKTYTDLNVIPLEAVERVEILKDGGSAIYGSDAIAGVVNIILRKEFSGVQATASVGQSLKYGDARDTRASIIGGFGNLETDRYNVLLDLEYQKQEPVYYSNRIDRGRIGKTDLRTDGFDATDTTGGGVAAGGTGAITLNGAGLPTGAANSVNGNVRSPFAGTYNGTAYAANTVYYSRGNTSPTTGFTRQFPGAACSNFTDHAQGDPGGACVIDATQQFRQLLSRNESFNSFGRASFAVTDSVTAYVEANLFHKQQAYALTPSAVSGTQYAPSTNPAGVTTLITNASALGTMGANNPDNPYFGTPARLRYLTTDIGPRTVNAEIDFGRLTAGIKGTLLGWDVDSAVLYSRDHVVYTRGGFPQIDVLNALLNPTPANMAAASAASTAYRALPSGTYYRIGENAGLNTAQVYAALAPPIHSYGDAKEALVDVKVARELFALPGGALGFALGAEARHESNALSATEGTERANILGLGYSAYRLSRNIQAAYAELNAPVIKQVELSLAGRYDHYSDVGNAFAPKAGIKITPIEQVALRGTFTRGFRAPNAPETGGGTTATSASTDPVRCALGVATACSSNSVQFVSLGNPNVKPEHSKIFTGGIVLDPTKTTTIAIDYFKIRRKNEIIAGSGTNESAVLAGRVLRDPTTTQPGIANDPGALVAILAPYTNSNYTQVRGVDLDARQDVPLGGFGKLSFGAKYTHLFSFLVVDQEGNKSEYANTHGNINTSNATGTPGNRANFDVTYLYGPLTVSTIANYRGSFPNIETKGSACETVLHTGENNPGNCRIGSFITFDLTGRYQITKDAEIFGSIQNLFDRKPPYDPTTYGIIDVNPLDYSGAVGRTFLAGARVKF